MLWSVAQVHTLHPPEVWSSLFHCWRCCLPRGHSLILLQELCSVPGARSCFATGVPVPGVAHTQSSVCVEVHRSGPLASLGTTLKGHRNFWALCGIGWGLLFRHHNSAFPPSQVFPKAIPSKTSWIHILPLRIHFLQELNPHKECF